MAYLDIQGINIVLDIAYPQWLTGYPGNKLCIGYCLSSMAYLDIQGINFVLDIAYPQWLILISRE